MAPLRPDEEGERGSRQVIRHTRVRNVQDKGADLACRRLPPTPSLPPATADPVTQVQGESPGSSGLVQGAAGEVREDDVAGAIKLVQMDLLTTNAMPVKEALQQLAKTKLKVIRGMCGR